MIRRSRLNWAKLHSREINSSFVGFEPFQFNVKVRSSRLTLKINLTEKEREEESEKNFETWSSRSLARSSDAV